MLRKKQDGPVTAYRMGRSIGGRVIYVVHSFLIGDTLVDTGAHWTRDEFTAALEPENIARIVNTHHHEDHVGANRAIAEKTGADIFAHGDALPRLKNPDWLNLRFYQRIAWGWPEPSPGKIAGEEVPAGESSLKTIRTPGHTPDHICLYEPAEGILFTGDLFCGRKFKYLRLEENYDQILSSLNELHELDFDTICCSLFGVVRNGKKSLKSKIDFMEELRGKVLELHKKETDPDTMAQKLLGSEGFMKFVTGGHYSLRNTVDSIITGRSKVEYRPVDP